MAEPFVVYVSDHCPTCPEALLIAERLKQLYPSVDVTVSNVDQERPHPEVFAVPTYMLGDRIAFLGNPTDEQIEELFGNTEFVEDDIPSARP